MTFCYLLKGCQTLPRFSELRNNELLVSSKWKSECRPSLIPCIDLHCVQGDKSQHNPQERSVIEKGGNIWKFKSG